MGLCQLQISQGITTIKSFYSTIIFQMKRLKGSSYSQDKRILLIINSHSRWIQGGPLSRPILIRGSWILTWHKKIFHWIEREGLSKLRKRISTSLISTTQRSTDRRSLNRLYTRMNSTVSLATLRCYGGTWVLTWSAKMNNRKWWVSSPFKTLPWNPGNSSLNSTCTSNTFNHSNNLSIS